MIQPIPIHPTTYTRTHACTHAHTPVVTSHLMEFRERQVYSWETSNDDCTHYIWVAFSSITEQAIGDSGFQKISIIPTSQRLGLCSVAQNYAQTIFRQAENVIILAVWIQSLWYYAQLHVLHLVYADFTMGKWGSWMLSLRHNYNALTLDLCCH